LGLDQRMSGVDGALGGRLGRLLHVRMRSSDFRGERGKAIASDHRVFSS
jgi:hypothetical protein